MKARISKLASVVAHAGLGEEVTLGRAIPARAGVVVVGRLLDDMPHELELGCGRMVQARAGDIVAGALGARRALRGVAGCVPPSIKVGDVLHVLNRGGVIGLADDAGAARLAVLGGVDEGQGPVSIVAGAVVPLPHLPSLPPVIAVAGSCMHAGKTAAACALVHGLSQAGYRVGVVKLTGVAAQRDVLAMRDCGAMAVATFVDGGLVSTCSGGDVVGVARGCLAKVAAEGADIIVAELGDGLLGDYGVGLILAAEDVREAISTCVLSAVDPVAAWGGVELLRRFGIATSVVTGATTDNVAGKDAVSKHTGIAVANALSERQALCHLVLQALNTPATEDRPASVQHEADKSPRMHIAALAATVLGGV